MGQDLNLVWDRLAPEERQEVLDDPRLKALYGKSRMCRAIAREISRTEFAPHKLDLARLVVLIVLFIQFLFFFLVLLDFTLQIGIL